jgi:protein gp37
MEGRMSFNQNSIEAFDDRLYTPEVGSWAKNKYKILHHYNHMFATGMKNRFHNRNYVELFSSAVRFLSLEPLISRIGKMELRKIDWVIAGGESGPKARTLEQEWAIHIKNICEKFGIPFFFKQWGGIRRHRTKRSLLGKTWDNMPTPKNLKRRKAALKY